uniref:lysozyme n=1 Tax=Glossina morsitans morsitans TaxID=37546 RepID=A0A1B0FF34_GLOMM
MPLRKQQKHRLIIISAVIISLFLITASIYMHIRQKPHLGRMRHNNGRSMTNQNIGSLTLTAPHDDKLYKSVKSTANTDQQHFQMLTRQCLHCLCAMITGCQADGCGTNLPCNLYQISKSYWIEAGRPQVNDQNHNIHYNDYDETDKDINEYATCARNRICSEQTINSYMQRYSRDCNQDGIIDCQDYIALQVLGQNGCTRQQMSTTHVSFMNECLKQHLQK